MEERLKITNPDKVDISLELAGLGSRALASILDSVIKTFVIVVVVILGFVFFALGDRLASLDKAVTGWTVAIFLIFVVLFLSGYGAIFEIIWNGQTPGKRWSKIRVVMENGQAVSVMAIMIRNILRLVDSLPANYLLGGVLVFYSSKNQRLGDMLAGTVVIREHKVDISNLSPPVSGKSEDNGDLASLMGISSSLKFEEVQLIQEFLARQKKVSSERAEALGKELSKKIGDRLGIPEEQRGEWQEFLPNILQAYRKLGEKENE